MCVIILLSPGTMLNKDKFMNAVHNNWHSWGIVLKDAEGRTHMQKECPPTGENDGEAIWKLLEDNKDIERALHLRHTTKGATNIENAQPFQVYSSDRRQVFFMHNGTLASFGSHLQTGDSISDTRDFCEKILSPALLRWHGEKGVADYYDPEFYRLLIDKNWSTNSTGLFISNDLPIKTIGNGWSKYPNKEGDGDVWVSNTSYFDAVTRGPEKLRRDEALRKQKEEERKSSGNFHNGHTGYSGGSVFDSDDNEGWGYGSRGITHGHNSYQPYQHRGSTSVTAQEITTQSTKKSGEVFGALNKMYKDVDFTDASQISKLDLVTFDEWAQYIEDESNYSIAYLIEVLIDLIVLQKEDLKNNLKEISRIERVNGRYRLALSKYNLMIKENEVEETNAAVS